MTTFLRRQAAAVAVAALLTLLVSQGAAATAPGVPTGWSHRDVHICGPAAGDQAACASIARLLYADGLEYHAATPAQLNAAARAAASTYYWATAIRKAYGITGVGDPSKVIAIVDAYDDPSAYSNLTTYRNYNGLPAIDTCALGTLSALSSSATNPCFAKVNQNGGTTLPAADAGWSNEIDLDLQAASAICPRCSLLLLEGSSTGFGDLGTAVATAANTPHVLAISNSYGTTVDLPGSFYPAWDNAAKKGIAVMASTGDWGYATSFPAAATNVIAVGGTTLAVDANGARTAETVWSGTGSGCSTYNAAPSWQLVPGRPCGSMKATADVSADADPSSGLAIYTTYNGTTGWWVFGGTSLSSPLVAALYAVQGGYGGTVLAGQVAWASTTPYFDVTSGSNGSCSPSVLCTAGTGWDGPTGRGSIATSTAPPALTKITVLPAYASVRVGQTLQFTATGYDQYGAALNPPPTFTWSVAGGGSISTTGLFTAVSSEGSPFAVTAASGEITGSTQVTVLAAPILTAIIVSPTTANVAVGGTQQFTAQALDQYQAPLDPQPAFTWSVSAGGSISSSGLFTATTAGGPYTVTASSGATSGPASVTVTTPTPAFTLSVSPSSRSIKRGQSTRYSITIARSGGLTGSVAFAASGLPSGVTWSFSPSSTSGTSSTLNVATTKSAPSGTFTLTVTGTSGTITSSRTVTLTLR